jgi:hypothetical protein
MHSNTTILFFSFTWLLGPLQHSVAQDQVPATSAAATTGLLLNATASIPYNASLSRRQVPQPSSDKVEKLVYFCKGHLNGGGNNDCPNTTCTKWENWVDIQEVEAYEPGTNCIDTDCNTNLRICDKPRKLWPHYQQCKSITSYKPSLTPWDRCCYDVPGTEYIYLSL